MFRNSLKMLLSGGKSNRKNRSSEFMEFLEEAATWMPESQLHADVRSETPPEQHQQEEEEEATLTRPLLAGLEEEIDQPHPLGPRPVGVTPSFPSGVLTSGSTIPIPSPASPALQQIQPPTPSPQAAPEQHTTGAQASQRHMPQVDTSGPHVPAGFTHQQLSRQLYDMAGDVHSMLEEARGHGRPGSASLESDRERVPIHEILNTIRDQQQQQGELMQDIRRLLLLLERQMTRVEQYYVASTEQGNINSGVLREICQQNRVIMAGLAHVLHVPMDPLAVSLERPAQTLGTSTPTDPNVLGAPRPPSPRLLSDPTTVPPTLYHAQTLPPPTLEPLISLPSHHTISVTSSLVAQPPSQRQPCPVPSSYPSTLAPPPHSVTPSPLPQPTLLYLPLQPNVSSRSLPCVTTGPHPSVSHMPPVSVVPVPLPSVSTTPYPAYVVPSHSHSSSHFPPPPPPQFFGSAATSLPCPSVAPVLPPAAATGPLDLTTRFPPPRPDHP